MKVMQNFYVRETIAHLAFMKLIKISYEHTTHEAVVLEYIIVSNTSSK